MAQALAVETHGLSKRYSTGVMAVNDLTLLVKTGEVYGFLGPNGAGKTTTLRMLSGAIGGGLTYLFVLEALIAQLLRDTAGVKEILKFLPGVHAGAVNASFGLTFRSPNATTPLVGAERGVITLLLYLAIFTIGSLLIFRERDVGGS